MKKTDPKKTKWTNHRTERLIGLVNDGRDIRTIAFSLGCSVTAVRDKANELGLEFGSEIKFISKAHTDEFRDPVQGSKKISELSVKDCRFPLGDPRKEGFGFCGKPRGKHRSYCDDHAEIISRPASSYDDYMMKVEAKHDD